MDLTRHKRADSAQIETALESGASHKPSLQWVAFVSRDDPPEDLFAVLRTCRQVLQETMSLLFAQVVFCFLLGGDKYDYCNWHNHRFSPERSLPMVQQFHIIMKEDMFKVSVCDIEDILAYFEDGNALRRLILEFQFLSDAEWCGESCRDWMRALGANTAIPKMIAALKSLHHFQILMNDYSPQMETLIAPFVRQVETAIGVAHDSKRWGFRKNKYGDGDGMGSHKWTWNLRPALDKSS